MPELPEVEMVARQLLALIGGRSVVRAELKRQSLAPEHAPAQFARLLKGAQIVDIGRRGKYIFIHLSNSRALVTHLRMTGRFVYTVAGRELPPHAHAIFHLDNSRRLIFADQRRFARMKIVPSEKLESALGALGPEPFDPDFTPEYLHRSLGRSRQAIKLALLDQKRVAGLGNIYAVEALHRARISPLLPASRLSLKRARLLHAEIVRVLADAVEAALALIPERAASDHDPDYEATYIDGASEQNWRVYDREGEACASCGAAIRRIIQGGRSTYYCPRCQAR